MASVSHWGINKSSTKTARNWEGEVRDSCGKLLWISHSDSYPIDGSKQVLRVKPGIIKSMKYSKVLSATLWCYKGSRSCVTNKNVLCPAGVAQW